MADWDLDPGFYRAHNSAHPDDVNAYFQVTEDNKAVLVYPSGEVARNDAAVFLIREVLLKHSLTSIERVAKEKTPFEDEVEPRVAGEPDPVHPVFTDD